MVFTEVRRRLADPDTRVGAAVELGDWARDLCLLMGAELQTALNVGAALTLGLDVEWADDPKPAPDGPQLRDVGAVYKRKVKKKGSEEDGRHE